MMRAFSWILSILLHVAALLVLLQTVRLAMPDLHDVMEVELTHVKVPDELIQPMPSPPPVSPASVPDTSQQCAPALAPLPMNKTVVLDDAPPIEASTTEKQPAPVRAAPSQTPIIPETPSPSTPDAVAVTRPDSTAQDEPIHRITVRRHDILSHRGHEARFGRTMMADYYSYSSTEFSGQFTTKDNRVISIIDARNTKYGRFLIYDSKNKTLRRMKQAMGKYVYTIGPSLYEDTPVTGAITFLAKDDQIERFILTTDDDRIAHFPIKIHVREEDMPFPTASGDMTGYASFPPRGEKHSGVVYLHGNTCVDQSMVRSFTRTLSAQNIASFTFQPRGCDKTPASPAPTPYLVADTVSALAHFASLPETNSKSTGIWGTGPGAPHAITAAICPSHQPSFVVIMIDDTIMPSAMPNQRELMQLNMPVLWLITGRRTESWTTYITLLETLRDNKNKPFTVVVAPLKNGEVRRDTTDLSDWVERVTENHAQLAASWIQQLEK